MLHTSKQYFLHFSVALFLGTNISMDAMSEKSVISTYQGLNGPWQLLEYIFITKVQNELDHFQRHSFAALGIAGATFLAQSFLINKTKPSLDLDNNSKLNSGKNGVVQNLMTIVSTLAAGKTVYDYTTCVVKRNVQHKTLTHILEQWDTYRLNFPTSLIEYFDELAAQYQSQGSSFLTNQTVAATFELVTHHIEHHFENRYKKSEQKNASAIDTFKSCTDIWKNLG